MKEKTNLQEELNKFKEMCVDKEEQYKALDKLPITIDKKSEKSKELSHEMRESKRFESLEEKLSILAEKSMHKEEKKYKIVKKVNLDDIKKTAYELKLRFILKKIDINKIDKVLYKCFHDLIKLKNVSIFLPKRCSPKVMLQFQKSKKFCKSGPINFTYLRLKN